MAPSNRPTTSELAASLELIEARTEELLGAVDSLRAASAVENDRIWTALSGVAGMDGLAIGVAEIREVLSPLRRLVPPSTALPLQPGVAQALTAIRAALGGRRDTNFSSMTTVFDGPVPVIGQADPSLDPVDSLDYEEQVA